ncbi:putative pre-mRNA-splicing factor SYF2 [Blattamonas nauphoetae]|uniref:Pre-mRNA-splicing factor SYF2 n=1 Tax=Blattamonas nauphoetae TaxID=2049346 RepID=A0ABQ9XWP1_9EUKA|nr:putative pre-mRNA-splicing factor SYF2 [Blattamonas nauphoetae]
MESHEQSRSRQSRSLASRFTRDSEDESSSFDDDSDSDDSADISEGEKITPQKRQHSTESSSDSDSDSLRQKLFEIRTKINEAQRLNKQEVVEEERRKKTPFWKEERLRRKKEKIEREKRFTEAQEKGEEIPPEHLTESALQAKQKVKKEREKMFHTELDQYAASFTNKLASEAAFTKRTEHLRVSQEEYERQKKLLETEGDIGRQLLSLNTSTQKEKLAQELKAEKEKKDKYHRPRLNLTAGRDDEEEVTYIHKGNKKFNEKINRYYDQYTFEIKESFERGTAL